MSSPRVIHVIETELELRGDGTPESPFRRVRQYWTFDGVLLAEVDPHDVRAAQSDACCRITLPVER